MNVMIIGASSAIAGAVGRLYAAHGARLFLVARNAEKLDQVAADLKGRGAIGVQTFVMDANELELLPKMLESAWSVLGTVDVALIAHGTLPDQQRAENDLEYGIQEFRNNGESVIACLGGLAQRFEVQGKGTIAVIGSVAGDRGRASNYIYGSAKAAVETFTSGLRARMFQRGVHVVTIKPGFVATPMTATMKSPALLTVTADRVARDIIYAIEKQKAIVYTPGFWRLIMMIIRMIPEPIFKRLSI